ncbi:MAG: PqqD family protein [Rhodothermales bacterium]|nr:PqqD family protein [Rhodothermales bacterium]MBO6779409.1 PqqD family protein [Rhodothermales bacterium]
MTVQIAGHPVASRPDDESVVILGSDRKYYSLTGPGRLVWDLLSAGPRTRPELVAAIVQSYEVEAPRAGADLDALLGQLMEAGLVEQAAA